MSALWIQMPPLRFSDQEKIQAVQERRRSGAAGLHGKKRKDRANTRRRAIEQDRRDG